MSALSDDDRADQDRRVRFQGPAVAPPGLRAVVLGVVRARVGWPVLEVSQDEALIVDQLSADLSHWRARFAYVLDRDFASQYDRTETLRGEVLVSGDGQLVASRWDDASPP